MYYFKSTSTAAPILFLAMIIYVKYFWILAIKIENIQQELNQDLAKLTREREKFKIDILNMRNIC